MKSTKGNTAKGKAEKTHESVGVQDQRSTRTASAIAQAVIRGPRQGEGSFRELEITVTVAPANGVYSSDCPSWVDIQVHSGQFSKPMRTVKFELSQVELSDLPLIALALTAALKEGVKTGSFPALEGLGETK